MYLSDDGILKRVQAGDRKTYLHLFDRYYACIEGYARKQLNDAEAGRDIASETFLRAYRAVDGFRIGETTYLNYLFTICRRLIIDEQSRRRAAPVTSLEEAGIGEEYLDAGAQLPLDRMLQQESYAAVREAMTLLPMEDREIILLAFERDLSRQDIAAILGKPTVSAVTSHLYRAMRKLKTVITNQGYFAASSRS